MKKRYNVIIVFVICLIDQLVKFMIAKNFVPYEKLVLIKNFFKIEYVKNTGISFGMLGGQKLIIILISMIIIAFMIYDLIKSDSKLHSAACTLIISGALGNLVDRIIRGYVVDYLSFTIMKKDLAIFNIADICVTVGVLLYVLYVFIGNKEEDEEDEDEDIDSE